jgi:imidazoleglycerol-phosphate dehydratase
MANRTGLVTRSTHDTRVTINLNVDGTGNCDIDTGVGFFDHMLSQVGRTALFDMSISAQGDIHVDAHHIVEDVAITLGQAFSQAMEEKRGIIRYGWSRAPLDEVLAVVSVDLSGRPYAIYRSSPPISTPMVGTYDNTLTQHVVESFAVHARACIHVDIVGARNPHHAHEAVFKALGLALRQACSYDPRNADIPSTKGLL